MFDDFRPVLKDNALKRKLALENCCLDLLNNDSEVIVIDPDNSIVRPCMERVQKTEILSDVSQSVNIVNFKVKP